MFLSQLQQMLITIAQSEKKIQSYRQLLNEEIQFNIKDLYMLASANASQITVYHLQAFINGSKEQGEENEEEGVDAGALESMIKGYNNCSSMNLSFIEFALIFLSRENKLLAKLALERNSLGEIPEYLIIYSIKILELESQLHRSLISFRTKYSTAAEQWIKQSTFINSQTGESEFDQKIIKQMCQQVEIDFSAVCRYLKVNDKDTIKTSKMLALFTLKNCGKLSEYLKKVQNKKDRPNLKDIPNPFIRPEFHDCLERPKILQNFSFRQLKSIEKHLQRLNSRSKNQLQQKISNYRTFIERQLKIACLSINEIIWLERQIQYQRIELCLCTDFYPVLFFDTFNKDRSSYLIPSSLQNYMERLGVKVELNHLYTIFKRYSSRADGKLTFNEFCSIFDVANSQYTHIEKNRQVRTLEDVEIETIKHFLRLLKLLCKNELKIEKIKAKLQSETNLREVFSVFDGDEDGYISMLDFRVIWKKFLYMDLKEEEISLIWHRMKLPKDPNNMIKYEKFISEMTPRSSWVQKSGKTKNKGNKTLK